MNISPLSRNDCLISLGLALLVLVLGYYQMVVGVCGIYHDDAVYVSTAKSLAQGTGYKLINLPGSPNQTKYPILYPAMLAIIWKLWSSFPENLAIMQLFTLLIAAVTVGLTYLYLIRFHHFSRGIVITALLLCATSSPYLYFCGLTLSEMPFALLFIVAIWSLDRQMAKPDDRWNIQLLLGITIALPFLCRTIGFFIIPIGLMLLYGYGRPWRLTALVVLCVISPWIVWMLVASNGDTNAISAYYTDYISWWLTFGISNIKSFIVFNTLYTLIGSVTACIGLFNTNFWFPAKLWPLIAIIGVLAYTGLVRHLFKGGVLPCLLVGYLLVVLVWPWPPFRFLIPIMPFLLVYLLNSIYSLSKKIPFVTMPKGVGVLGIAFLLIVNSLTFYQGVKNSQNMHYPFLRQMNQPLSWSSYEDIFKWIKDNTELNAVIASGLDSMIYLYTGRKGLRPFELHPTSLFYGEDGSPLGTEENFMKLIGHYNALYLVRIPMPGSPIEKPLDELIKKVQDKYPAWLKIVYVGEDNRFLIFELQPEIPRRKSLNRALRNLGFIYG